LGGTALLQIALAAVALASVTPTLGAPASPQDSQALRAEIEAGDRAWERRAEGAEGDRAAAGPIAEAIAAYQRAVESAPEDLEALWKLERALHFQGEFTGLPATDRERTWERGTELAERALAVLHRGDAEWRSREPAAIAARIDAAQRSIGATIHFWAAVHWGLWGETKGSLAAVQKGIAKRIRDHARIAIALDETVEHGGPHRLLGRLHAVAPRVPLFTGWVSRDQAVAELERAVAIAPTDLTNRLYLAEVRLEHVPERREQARAEIAAVIAATPDAANLVEDRRTQADARATLAKTSGP
jgi:tetratricopeptide (TPR) repeat protein